MNATEKRSLNTKGWTIGVRSARTYNYFYWHMHNFGYAHIDKDAHFFPKI